MRLNGVQEVVGSNPASPSLVFSEDSFALKRLQSDGGVDRVRRSLRDRYGDEESNQGSEPPNQELLHKSCVPEVGLILFQDPFHDIRRQDDAP